MTEKKPLDPSELARRAMAHAGVRSNVENGADLDALASSLDELLLNVVALDTVWELPDGSKMRGSRSAALRLLKVFTDRQHELDSTMVAAVALLVEYCRALETQLEAVIARVDRLAESDDTVKGDA